LGRYNRPLPREPSPGYAIKWHQIRHGNGCRVYSYLEGILHQFRINGQFRGKRCGTVLEELQVVELGFGQRLGTSFQTRLCFLRLPLSNSSTHDVGMKLGPQLAGFDQRMSEIPVPQKQNSISDSVAGFSPESTTFFTYFYISTVHFDALSKYFASSQESVAVSVD
jgi:hypothetical protein